MYDASIKRFDGNIIEIEGDEEPDDKNTRLLRAAFLLASREVLECDGEAMEWATGIMTERWVEARQNFNPNAPRVFAVVDAHSQVVGMVETYIHGGSQPLLYVALIAVSKQYQGHGIGSDLLKHVEGVARKNNIAKVELVSDNPKTRGFYDKMGYSIAIDSDGNGFKAAKELTLIDINTKTCYDDSHEQAK